MTRGLELIVAERNEQLNKHEVSIIDDVQNNTKDQLMTAAKRLISDKEIRTVLYENPPAHWNKHIWKRMLDKPYKDRLVIAAALIAAELDRMQMQEDMTNAPITHN